MRARISLLFLLCLLTLPLCYHSLIFHDHQQKLQGYLEGTWVLYSVEKAGLISLQLPEEVDLHRKRLERLPELRDMPIDPLEDAVITTFTGSEYVTVQSNWVVAHGHFNLDLQTRPPTLLTRGIHINRFVHEHSMSVFVTEVEPVQSLAEISPDTLRITTWKTSVPRDKIVATFKRLESFESMPYLFFGSKCQEAFRRLDSRLVSE